MAKASAAPVRFVDVPPVTVRAQLDAGPKFEPEPGCCLACGNFRENEGGVVDTSTGLGLGCWRAFRWGYGREAGAPGDVVARKVG